MARTAHDWFDLAMEQRVEKDRLHSAVTPHCLRLAITSTLRIPFLSYRCCHMAACLLIPALPQPLRLGEDRSMPLFPIRQDPVCSVN